jgi:hypothetical protein
VANNHPFYLITKFKKMQLTKQHRESLIAELKITNQDMIIQRSIWDNRNKKSEMSNETMEEFESYIEIKLFLLQQRIETIEKALIENEIDY